MYDPEFYFYGIFPMIIGIVVLLVSIRQLFQYRGPVNWILSIIIVMSGCLAEFMLCMMFFFGAWPDFSAHLILLLITLLLFVQQFINRKKIELKGN